MVWNFEEAVSERVCFLFVVQSSLFRGSWLQWSWFYLNSVATMPISQRQGPIVKSGSNMLDQVEEGLGSWYQWNIKGRFGPVELPSTVSSWLEKDNDY